MSRPVIEAALFTALVGAGIYYRLPQRIAWRKWDIPRRIRYEAPLGKVPPVHTVFFWRGDGWRIISSVSLRPGYASQIAERIPA